MGDKVPVGYRFHPTDEELVGHYLKYKLLGDDSRVQNIAEVDVCKFEPWDLPAFSKEKSDDHEWYFFSPRELKYTRSTNRYNRRTKAGNWKPTGKDRDIKTRGTDHVIGTKKTLVFYRGRVKTNWVIHEYHAATFPVDKRAFVLCRLMEKAEKKSEGRSDVLINEGEPIADHENQARVDRIPDVYTLPEMNLESVFLEPPQAEESDFPSLLGSPIVTEQESYFEDPTFTTAYLGNENNIAQISFDATEEEDNLHWFLDSILVDDDDVYISEERVHSFVNEATPSQSLRKVHYESSETEAELISAQFGNILDTTLVSNEHAVSSGCQVMKMVTTSQNAAAFSSKTEVNRVKKDSTFGDNFGGVDSSDDSIANEHLPIFVMESVSSPSPPMAISSTSRRGKTKNHPRSDNNMSQGAAPRRSQTQRKLSSKASSQHEVQKEAHMLESNRDKRKAQDAGSRKNLKTTSNGSSSVNGKSCFIYQETPSISHPRSVYLLNVVVGFSLLLVTICDMVSFGKCC